MGTTHLQLKQCHLLKRWSEYPDGWVEEQYERHNQHVKDHVPEERLLVFNVKEGWKPLCDFLDKPVPEGKPFPHVKVNTSDGLLKLKGILKIVVWLWIPTLIFVIFVVSWTCCFRKKIVARQAKKD